MIYSDYSRTFWKARRTRTSNMLWKNNQIKKINWKKKKGLIAYFTTQRSMRYLVPRLSLLTVQSHIIIIQFFTSKRQMFHKMIKVTKTPTVKRRLNSVQINEGCEVRRIDNSTHWIYRFSVDSAICFVTLIRWMMIYPVDSVIHRSNNRALSGSV